jgi:molecular chaperone Hsp33
VDAYLGALIRPAQLTVGVAVTTETCRAAQLAQKLSSTSAVALGRLLTAAALTSNTKPQPVPLSLQIVGSGRLGQIFADITESGDLRGYVKNTSLAFPVGKDGSVRGRRLVAPGVGTGTLAVMRLGDGASYAHSTTDVVSGDVDRDVEHYLVVSEQVPTVLVCDVVLDEKNRVVHAGGAIVQALPGGDLERLQQLAAALHDGAFIAALEVTKDDAARLVSTVTPDAAVLAPARPLRWQCRCSPERVKGALTTLETLELAEMIQKGETTEVNCHFCGKDYVIGAEELREVYEARIRHQA